MCRCVANRKFERKLEPFFQVTPWIAEFWNTLSNLLFIIIGLARLYELSEIEVWPMEEVGINQLKLAYGLYTICGIASAIHHATTPRWTIVIDWMPIAISIGLNLYFGFLWSVGFASVFKVLLALSVLFSDHICTPINVPWGHCMWHLLAALAIDSCYQDVFKALM